MDSQTAAFWIAVAGVAVAVIFGVLQLRKKDAKAQSIQLATSRNENRIGGNQSLIGNLHVTLPPEILPILREPSMVPQDSRQKDLGGRPSDLPLEDEGREEEEETEEDLFDDMLEVPSGKMEALRFRLRRGDRVTGLGREIDGFPFDFYIMTESNYARFLDGEDAPVEREEEGVSSIPIRFRAPRTATWAFVFGTYGKQYDREIKVELRRTKAAS